ncbi:hypothetical protein RJT34_02622 [Clitoria ternatea]|uniref:Uncharacterized protein n=1 Tax=Clitoria ternatea TaxID=43366 RepID=A0AAN9KKM2_CLITE
MDKVVPQRGTGEHCRKGRTWVVANGSTHYLSLSLDVCVQEMKIGLVYCAQHLHLGIESARNRPQSLTLHSRQPPSEDTPHDTRFSDPSFHHNHSTGF